MASSTATEGGRRFSSFIVSNSIEKHDTATRKLIRSHAKRGRSHQKSMVSRLKPGNWINGYRDKNDSDPKLIQNGSEITFVRTQFDGSDLTVTRFAFDNTQPYMLDLIFKFCTVIKQSMYPIELCLAFDYRGSIWFQYLQSDPMYLHSTLWTTQAYFDWVKGQGSSLASMNHETNTLHLLQRRLVDPKTATSDITIAVVVTLVMMTILLGNHEAARKHIAGLHMMVTMRGGLHMLKENTQLQIKVCRADLVIALMNGTRPLFFSVDISWQPYLPPTKPNQLALAIQTPYLNNDIRLAAVWTDLRQFCISANVAFQTDQKIHPEVYQEILISIEYRLMHLICKDRSLETLHLAILAFSTTVFLQTEGVRVRYHDLSRQLHDSVLRLGASNQTPELWLWILFIAAISAVTDEDDQWLMPLLRAAFRRTGTTTWEPVRDILKSIMWIDALHDKDGKRVFDLVLLTYAEHFLSS
ncbi:hypothetical protein LHYA1_G003709 [Lachnellula hyalina]|uniref:Transcription factor domain-containing protein n=1 Tax=Lachnellula hyalina TaxID=1316788 RepID=A0A8H8QYW1_9HELO|nr:uncharacterized protein LHYA1_G003709 [Lachnellula hyalina]TVY25378.1 hypothetical protein LHYA1_G003709 [Lachnellula hyalina]